MKRTAILLFVVYLLCGCATPSLIRSSAKGNVSEIKAFVRSGVDINIRDKDGCTPLINSIRNQQSDAAKTLIDLGADINLPDDSGRTPLMYAAGYKQAPTIDLLVKKGAAVNAKDKGGLTALILAVQTKDIEAVRALLRNGADPNIKLNSHTSVLCLARVTRQHAIVEELIKAGAAHEETARIYVFRKERGPEEDWLFKTVRIFIGDLPPLYLHNENSIWVDVPPGPYNINLQRHELSCYYSGLLYCHPILQRSNDLILNAEARKTYYLAVHKPVKSFVEALKSLTSTIIFAIEQVSENVMKEILARPVPETTLPRDPIF